MYSTRYVTVYTTNKIKGNKCQQKIFLQAL